MKVKELLEKLHVSDVDYIDIHSVDVDHDYDQPDILCSVGWASRWSEFLTPYVLNLEVSKFSIDESGDTGLDIYITEAQ